MVRAGRLLDDCCAGERELVEQASNVRQSRERLRLGKLKTFTPPLATILAEKEISAV